MTCPVCNLPLNSEGKHVDPAKAWNLMECEYSVEENGELHPPIPDEPPAVVTNDAEYAALIEDKESTSVAINDLAAKLSEMRTKLATTISQMEIRELQILNPQPSLEDTYSVSWCKCIRCRQLRYQKAIK
ncbi:hypothetical protein OTK49_02590 [Vibrio coralliirubri]|uniref:hypothetical protein n=1 Tax=Vibrio coralliirubri TaxID=1516159 RepID=UPI0022834783|nr:hypothetical protein [Vibrio coralliirubri]MCY9861405.1 hypothetical protein [Vibrio coralliirubri]